MIVNKTNWGVKHWNSITHNYSKQSFLENIKMFFEILYMDSKELYLSQTNLKFIKTINDILGIKTIIRSFSEFDLKKEGLKS